MNSSFSARLLDDLFFYDLLLYKSISAAAVPPHLKSAKRGQVQLLLQLPGSAPLSAALKAHFLFFALLGRSPKLKLGAVRRAGGGSSKRGLSFLATAPLPSPLFDRFLADLLPTLSKRELPFHSVLTTSGWILVLKEFSELGFRTQQQDLFGWKTPLSFRFSFSRLQLSFFRIYL